MLGQIHAIFSCQLIGIWYKTISVFFPAGPALRIGWAPGLRRLGLGLNKSYRTAVILYISPLIRYILFKHIYKCI